MARSLLFCVLIPFLLVSCATTPHMVSTYWNQAAGILKEQGRAYYRTDSQGKQIEVKDGLWTTWHKNGKKHTEMRYKDDVLIGDAKVWYPNGKLQYAAHFDEHGLPDGEIQFYTVSGEVRSCIMTHGTGTLYYYYDDGKIRAELPYERGLLHGEARYFDSDGKILRSTQYQRGIEAAP